MIIRYISSLYDVDRMLMEFDDVPHKRTSLRTIVLYPTILCTYTVLCEIPVRPWWQQRIARLSNGACTSPVYQWCVAGRARQLRSTCSSVWTTATIFCADATCPLPPPECRPDAVRRPDAAAAAFSAEY